MARQNELAALHSMGIVSLARKEGLLGGLKAVTAKAQRAAQSPSQQGRDQGVLAGRQRPTMARQNGLVALRRMSYIFSCAQKKLRR